MKTIVDRSIAAENADWNVRPQYAFTQTERDGNGPANTYEVAMMLGSRYRRLIAMDGKPLSPDRVAEENRKMRDEMAHRKKESSSQRNERIEKAKRDRDQEHGMLLEMARAFNFRLQGEENIDGHDCWVLEAEPRPGYQPPNSHARVLTGMYGKLWVEKAGYHWAKVKADVLRPVYFDAFLARVDRGTEFVLEKRPVKDGPWLTTHFSMKVDAKILGLISHNSSEDDTFWNYRRTGTVTSASDRYSGGRSN